MKWKKFVKINFGRYICGSKQRNNAEYFTIRVSNTPPRISGGGISLIHNKLQKIRAKNTHMKQTIYTNYLAPEIEVNYIEVELGFAGSLLEDPIENPEQGW